MRILLRIVKYAWPYRLVWAGTYLAMLTTLSTGVIPMYLLGSAVDEVLASGSRGRLLLLAAAILASGLAMGVSGYGQVYLQRRLSERAVYDLRKEFFAKLQRLSFAYHDRHRTGDLMSRGTTDIENLGSSIGDCLINVASNVSAVLIVAVILLITNPTLGLVALLFIPPMLWRGVAMALKLERKWSQAQAEAGRMTTVLHESLSGIRLVKAFRASRFEEAKFQDRAHSVRGHTFGANRLWVFNNALMNLILAGASVAVLLVGGRELEGGRLSPGEFASSILLVGYLVFQAGRIGWWVNSAALGVSSGRRVFEVLDAESSVRTRPGARSIERVRGRVAFEDVSLSYESGPPAVRGISLQVEPGQVVALLGPPGSGKSTVVHMVPRFYDPSTGRVIVDGVDIRDMTLSSLRSNVGIVLQDVFIFGASLRDNIAYGTDSVSPQEIVRAAKIAQLDDFARSLPEGYDTIVGERGVTLSGGQQQRLAIARTILLDPPILILDDSTSGVDVTTERLIQNALARVIEGRTTFVIAHRLSTIRKADIILVMEEGRILERGTHLELLAGNGYYRRIHDLQLKPQEIDALFRGSTSTAEGAYS